MSPEVGNEETDCFEMPTFGQDFIYS